VANHSRRANGQIAVLIARKHLEPISRSCIKEAITMQGHVFAQPKAVTVALAIALVAASYLTVRPVQAQDTVSLPLAVCGTVTRYEAPTTINPGFIGLRALTVGEIGYEIAAGMSPAAVPVGNSMCLQGTLASPMIDGMAPQIVSMDSLVSYVALGTCGRNVTEYSGDRMVLSGMRYPVAPGARLSTEAFGQNAQLNVLMDVNGRVFAAISNGPCTSSAPDFVTLPPTAFSGNAEVAGVQAGLSNLPSAVAAASNNPMINQIQVDGIDTILVRPAPLADGTILPLQFNVTE
jgi:hypothetical protein